MPGGPGDLCQAVGMGALYRGKDWVPMPHAGLLGCLAHPVGIQHQQQPVGYNGQPGVGGLHQVAGIGELHRGKDYVLLTGAGLLGCPVHPDGAQH